MCNMLLLHWSPADWLHKPRMCNKVSSIIHDKASYSRLLTNRHDLKKYFIEVSDSEVNSHDANDVIRLLMQSTTPIISPQNKIHSTLSSNTILGTHFET